MPANHGEEKPNNVPTQKVLKHKKVRIPWTEAHYRQHKEEMRRQKLPSPISERVSAYSFLFDGKQNPVSIECLHVDISEEEWESGYESSDDANHFGGIKETLRHCWSSLFRGNAALQQKIPTSESARGDVKPGFSPTTDTEVSDVDDEFDNGMGPPPRLCYRIATINISKHPDDGVTSLGDIPDEEITIQSWVKDSQLGR